MAWTERDERPDARSGQGEPSGAIRGDGAARRFALVFGRRRRPFDPLAASNVVGGTALFALLAHAQAMQEL